MKNYPKKFNFNTRLRYTIDGEPIGQQISLDQFIGYDYMNKNININDYREHPLAYAILEPPYGIHIKIDAERGTPEYDIIKVKEFTSIYRMFLNDFILLSEYNEEDLIIYSWSDDWSNFFDAGKEWWAYIIIPYITSETILLLY